MKIQLPDGFFGNNKIKEVYYNSFLVKQVEAKFFPEALPCFVQLEAKTEVKLMELPWGCSRKSMIRFLGNPRFIIKPHQQASQEIFFFKQQIHGEKSIIQCHFLSDQFYFAHVDFISSLSSENKKILSLLQQKYCYDQFPDEKIIIRDRDGNRILVDRNVYLRLDYLTGRGALIEKMKSVASRHRQAVLLASTLKPDTLIQL